MPPEAEAEAPQGETAPELENNLTEQQPSTEQPAPEGEKPPEAPKETRKPWFQERIDELTRQKHEERRERERLSAELEAAKALLPKKEGEEPSKVAPKDYQEAVEKRAAELAEERVFAAACNKVFEEGVKTHGDAFKAAVGNLNAAGVANRDFLETALDTEAPALLLNHLGNEPEEAIRISRLPPRKMAIELDRLAGRLARPDTKKPVSQAPDPIRPITGTAKSGFDPYDPNADMDEFMAWRAKERSRK